MAVDEGLVHDALERHTIVRDDDYAALQVQPVLLEAVERLRAENNVDIFDPGAGGFNVTLRVHTQRRARRVAIRASSAASRGSLCVVRGAGVQASLFWWSEV